MSGEPIAQGPYTTITVEEYNHMTATLRHLRKRLQKARELLEVGNVGEALNIVKHEYDTMQ